MDDKNGGAISARFIEETGLAHGIALLAEPVLANLGLRLIRVQLSGRDGQTLQVMAERPGGTMTIEDCETVSRELSPLLDAHDPLPGSYRLEVSSPGIDRPLVRVSDFDEWSGYEARIELKEPVAGRKRYRGGLEGFVAGEVRMACDIDGAGRQVIGLPIALIADAKLVLTDELVREALRRAKNEQKAARARGALTTKDE